MDGIKFEKVFVTPIMAQEWLNSNPKNRELRNPIVRSYVNQMENGQWQEETGEAIKISKNGILLDGQHRLTALIRFGKGLHFHIISGLEEKVFTVLDTGKRRNSADTLKISGVGNATTTGAAITSWYAIRKMRSLGSSSKLDYGVTNEDILREYNARPEFWDNIVTEGRHAYKTFNYTLAPGFLIGWWAVLHDINPEKAAEFMYKLTTGYNIKEGDVIGEFRRILLKSRGGNTKLTNTYKNGLLIKAWNYFIKDKTVKLFQYNEKIEKMPQLEGLNTAINADIPETVEA